MNLETKITIYKFTPQVFTLTHFSGMLQIKDIICPNKEYIQKIFLISKQSYSNESFAVFFNVTAKSL